MSEIKQSTWDAKTAAKYIGISYWLILELAKKGEIPCIRANSRVLFRKETLDKWMDKQEEDSITKQIGIGVIRKIKE